MTDVAKLKTRLRTEFNKRRNELADRNEKSQCIQSRVLQMPQIKSAKMVCCFVSFRSEVQTHDLIDRLLESQTQVCVPWCNGEVLGLCRIESLHELKPRTMGILEPPTSRRNRADRSCQIFDCQSVIVPGLAFTESGARLGYGKGHYDRMLADGPDAVRIAVAFECQIAPELPTDQYDIPMDSIVTEKRLVDCRKA